MSWDDWEVVWRRQTLPAGATANVTDIKETFEKKHRKLHVLLLLRNTAEGGTGVILTPVMIYLWLRHGKAGWPLAISAALLFSVTCVFIFDQLRIWRQRLGPGASLLAKVEAELSELRHQRRMIQTWGWWYLLPGLVAIIIGFITLSRLNFGKAPPGFLADLLTTPITLVWIVVLALTFGYALWRVWQGNREAVFKQINPRIQELEKLRDHMLSLESAVIQPT